MAREATLVSLALFVVFFFAGAAESFGNPLAIKADSAHWATWEDGQHIGGLSESYNECWNTATGLEGKSLCLKVEIKRIAAETKAVSELLDGLNMTEEQRMYLEAAHGGISAMVTNSIEFASDPALESPYAALAMRAVLAQHVSAIIDFMYILQSGNQ